MSASNLEELVKGRRSNLLAEVWFFLKTNKKWWLLPFFLALAVLALLTLVSTSSFAPFIYTLF